MKPQSNHLILVSTYHMKILHNLKPKKYQKEFKSEKKNLKYETLYSPTLATHGFFNLTQLQPKYHIRSSILLCPFALSTPLTSQNSSSPPTILLVYFFMSPNPNQKTLNHEDLN